MAIEPVMGPGGYSDPDAGLAQGLGVDVAIAMPPGPVSVEITPDGAEVTFGEEEKSGQPESFDDNLAEYVDEGELESIGRKLVELVDMDDRSRSDWKRAYVKGLDLLGFTYEERTDPWSGACGAFHPVMTEAAVRFQSQAIMEIFPSGGPVRAKTIGKWSREKQEQAERVEQELNYFVTERMTEFRPETETLLFYLALAGSAFRKSFYDLDARRPVSRFVPAEDFIVPYGTTDLKTCPRYTQVMRLFPNELKKMQAQGFYLDFELQKPVQVSNPVEEAYNKLQGRARVPETDERYELFEVHADWDLAGFEDVDPETGEETGVQLPYVFTVEKYTQKVMSIRRNWEESDPGRIRIQHFTPYFYLPGLGFYGTGLIHLIGGITKSSTSILRQLVDAGTLANLPGGLKSRGMRIKGDDSPIMPGEFRDVDVPSGNIRDNITFLPYKEPSEVLHSLLNDLVAEGRRLGAAPDLPINAMTQQAPVGTTLALLERSMKVMSAVQARLHASLKEDFKKIAQLIAKDMGPKYEYEVSDPKASRVEDFSRVDIIPVSDPNAASMAQRIVQFQTALQLAQSNPEAFDMPLLYKDGMSLIGLPNGNKIVKDPDDIPSRDPVAENMAILTGKPVKAYLWQDHQAHITVHMAAAQDPKILQLVGQSPQASLIQGAMSSHLAEHLAMAYRRGIEEQMGVPLPPPEEPLPQDVEVQLSKVVAEAGKRLLQKDQQEAQMQRNKQMMEDPIIQMQMREAAVKEQEAKIKADRLRLDEQKAQWDAQLRAASLLQKEEAEKRRLSSQEQVAGAALGVKIGQSKADEDSIQRQRALDTATELMTLQARSAELKLREQEIKNRKGNGSQPH